MSITSSLPVLAATAGVSMAAAPLLQIRTMVRRRSSDDVSLGYLAVLMFGFSTWLAYGWSISNVALIVTNTSSLSVCAVTIAVAVRFRSGRGAPHAAVTAAVEPAASR